MKSGTAFLAGIMTFSPTVVLGVLATDTPESNKDILKINELLAKGANINYVDESGWTPLMYAADGGHPTIAQHLISKGARKDISGPWGAWKPKNYTPLAIAQYHLDTYTRIGQQDIGQPNIQTQDYINRYTALVKILGNTR